MNEQQIAPGPDEIALSAPAAGQLCTSREHRQAGRPAQVVVTLGPMGTTDQHHQALWMETWGRSYPMCQPCSQATRQVAQARRPALVITGTTPRPDDQAPARPGRAPPAAREPGRPDQGCKAGIKATATGTAHACIHGSRQVLPLAAGTQAKPPRGVRGVPMVAGAG
jgi:hypothetical protein